MLVLFETAAGFALFKVLKEKKIRKVDDLSTEFETLDKASKLIKLKALLSRIQSQGMPQPGCFHLNL